MSDDPAVLTVRGLSFSYGKRPVLTDVGFQVRRGEFAALVGPNGSGKSTLIRLITRLLPPISGEILIEGTPVSRLSPAGLALRAAVVPQESAIDFDFTAFEVTLMGRNPHLGPLGRESEADREAAREAMSLTDTAHLANRSILELSGGERQRVIVARALAQAPRLLLLDEPTSHLDINHQVDLLTLVLRLCRETGLAALAVLHDLNLAAAFADRVLVLREGKVDADGAPGEVMTAERIRRVFNARTQVIEHPVTGRPVVLLEPGRTDAE